LAPLRLSFDSSVVLNVLLGDNGAGKTNVIEALYYLSVFRSFRTSRAADLVQRGWGAAEIAVEAQTEDLTRSIDVRLALRTPGETASGDGLTLSGAVSRARAPAASRTVTRSINLDGKAVRGVAATFGLLSVVLFVPEDLLLVRAAPSARRRFVDMAVSAVEATYFAEAAAFQRILRTRNAVLRTGQSPALPGLLDTYDEQLAQAGARVVMRRRHLVQALAPGADRLFRQLHGDSPVGLAYVSDPTIMSAISEADVSRALLAGIARRRRIDERRQHTTFGPQTDDLEIHLGERPAREHASQGQLRSLVLALKLAELAYVEVRKGEAPVLLLDDVPSELDPLRRKALFDALAVLSCQTVVSVADPTIVPKVVGRADFAVRGGQVSPDQVFSLQTRT
jgi:DNA replication and repair protein RecF